MEAASNALAPDPAVIQQWCDWWFHHCTRGEIQIGWRNAHTGGLTEFRSFAIGDETIGETVAAINAIPGQSCYARASTVRAGLGTKAAEDTDFAQAPGIWGDLDDEGAYVRAGKVEPMVRPSAWVETGKHPHWRAQCFWRLEGVCENPVAIKALNERVVALYQGDSAVTNPTRLMRLPGTIAWPAKQGRVVEKTGLIIPEGRPPQSIEFLSRVLPQPGAAAPPPSAAPATGSIFPGINTSGALIARIRAGDQWHNNMVKLVAHWIGRGWSDAEILAATECFTLAGYTAAQTAAEVGKAIEGGRRKWGVPDQHHDITGEGPATPFEGAPFDPWDTLKPLAFPADVLPPELRAFAASRARAIGCDLAAIAMCCLSALSVALDGRSRLRMKRYDPWSVPPAIWVALLGPSSAKKSPAMRAAWSPLERRQDVLLRNHAAAMGAWKSQPKDLRGDPPRAPTRYATHDSTMEAVQAILSEQDRGLGMIRDELAGFIGAMEKYSGGKGGAADRAFFLQSFDGGAHVVDRVGRGVVPVSNLLLTICGGIQPDRLASFGDLTDDGLWQRFVPVIMSNGGLGDDVPIGEAEDQYEALVDYMLGLPSMMATLSDDARKERETVEIRLYALEQTGALGGAFTSFVGKMHGLWGRLALVLHAASRPPQRLGGMLEVIPGDTARQATRLVFDYIVPSAARVYAAMGGAGGKPEPVKDIAGYILTKNLERLLVSDLTRNVRCARGMGLVEVQRLVSPLVAGGWLAPEKDHNGNNAWTVNAAVHELFSSRARQEAARRETLRSLIVQPGEAP